VLNIKKLIWDLWNIAHIARHEVIPEEVEDSCHNNPKTEKDIRNVFFFWDQQKWGEY